MGGRLLLSWAPPDCMRSSEDSLRLAASASWSMMRMRFLLRSCRSSSEEARLACCLCFCMSGMAPSLPERASATVCEGLSLPPCCAVVSVAAPGSSSVWVSGAGDDSVQMCRLAGFKRECANHQAPIRVS